MKIIKLMAATLSLVVFIPVACVYVLFAGGIDHWADRQMRKVDNLTRGM